MIFYKLCFDVRVGWQKSKSSQGRDGRPNPIIKQSTLLLGSGVDSSPQISAIPDNRYLALRVLPKMVGVSSSSIWPIAEDEALGRRYNSSHVMEDFMRGVDGVLHEMAVVEARSQDKKVIFKYPRLCAHRVHGDSPWAEDQGNAHH